MADIEGHGPLDGVAEVAGAVVVEELIFVIAAELLDQWLAADAAAWDRALAASPGFLGKEVWVPANGEDGVRVVIWWRSADDQSRAAHTIQQAADRRMGRLQLEPIGHDLRRVRRLEPDLHRPDHVRVAAMPPSVLRHDRQT
jgi:uncharacterized protein (TIGR03792 family)